MHLGRGVQECGLNCCVFNTLAVFFLDELHVTFVKQNLLNSFVLM